MRSLPLKKIPVPPCNYSLDLVFGLFGGRGGEEELVDTRQEMESKVGYYSLVPLLMVVYIKADENEDSEKDGRWWMIRANH